MAVHIRLARFGTKKSPLFRVVVTDHRYPRDGRFIENIGTFDPSPAQGLSVNTARLDYWRSKGAQPSHTLDRLLKRIPKAISAATQG